MTQSACLVHVNAQTSSFGQSIAFKLHRGEGKRAGKDRPCECTNPAFADDAYMLVDVLLPDGVAGSICGGCGLQQLQNQNRAASGRPTLQFKKICSRGTRVHGDLHVPTPALWATLRTLGKAI